MANTELGNTKLMLGDSNQAEIYRDSTTGNVVSNANLEINTGDTVSEIKLTSLSQFAKMQMDGGSFMVEVGGTDVMYMNTSNIYFAKTVRPPTGNSSTDIGTSANPFRSMYLSGTASVGNSTDSTASLYLTNSSGTGQVRVNGNSTQILGPGDTDAALFYDGHCKLQGGSLLGPTDGFLKLVADRGVYVYLDYDGDETGYFQVYNGESNAVFTVSEAGSMTLQRNDAGTQQESTFYQKGASRDFYWATLSSNLRLMDSTYGEIVRFNFSGTRFAMDLKPLYNWDSTTSPANLGSTTEVWKESHINNIYNYGSVISPPQTLDSTTTPSVANGRVFKVPVLSSAAVDIGAFDDSVDGQEIILLGVAQPTYTWKIYATNSFTQINGTWTSAAGASLHLIKDGVNWIEISRR